MTFRADLARFEAARAKTEHMVSGLSQTQMDYKPAADKWSVGEVVDHLLKAESLFREDIAELIRLAGSGKPPILKRSLRDMDVTIGPIPRRIFAWAELPLTILSTVTPKPVADALLHSRLLPTKNPTVATPRHGRPAPELRRELREAIERMRALFEGNADAEFSRMVHKSPLTGTYSPMDMLRFLALHEGRHQKQMAEILESPGFPRPAAAEEGGRDS